MNLSGQLDAGVARVAYPPFGATFFRASAETREA